MPHMRKQDVPVFQAAAQQYGRWIVVRKTNPNWGTTYTLDGNPKSIHYGCLRCDGRYHADDDLCDVVDAADLKKDERQRQDFLGQVHFVVCRITLCGF